MSFEMTQDANVPTSGSFGSQKVKFKIPQISDLADITSGPPSSLNTFSDESAGSNVNSENWRKQHFRFQANKFYTVSKFHGLAFATDTNGFHFSPGIIQYNSVSPAFDSFQNVGVL